MSIPPAERPVALVTGASAGIGKAFAEELARRGNDLVLVARRRDRLEALAAQLRHGGTRVEVIVADLSERGAPAMTVEEALRRMGHVDVLVNNAGYGIGTSFAQTPVDEHLRFLDVLVVSWVELSRRLLPGMLERRFGRLIHVASVAAFTPETAGSLYFAAKQFIVSFSRALSLELEGTGVSSTAVCPGFTYSEFHDVLGNREHMKKLPAWMWQDAATVARQGIDAAAQGREVLVTGGVNKAIVALCRVLPRALIYALGPKDIMDRHDAVR
jgi:short-subunit dehydrogenase